MESSTIQAESTSAPPKEQSFWEDLIDIYVSPLGVFRRRQFKSVWPPLLFVSIAIGVIVFVTFSTLQPVFEGEFNRAIAQQAAHGGTPQATPEQLAKIREVSISVGRYVIGPVMLLTMLVLGVVAWVVGKMVGSKQGFQAAMVVAAWSYMPRVLGAAIDGAQGLFMDEAQLTGRTAVSLGPARLLNPDTANPLLLQALLRLDLPTLWVTVLLAVGLYATGKVSKEKAVIFGILIWVVGGLPAFRNGYLAM